MIESAAQPAPNRNALRFVVATIFIDAIGFGIVLPVLPGLVETLGHVGLDRATAIGGWMAAVYALAGFLMGPLIGNLGDRYGRRPVLLAALGGLCLDYVLMAAAPTLAWLFVGRVLAGALGATYGPATAAIADISAAEDRARRFGLLSAAFGIGFIVGPAIGGLLGTLGPRAPFWVAAGLAGANWLYGAAAFPETLAPALRRPLDWRRANPLGALKALRAVRGVLPLSAVYFLWSVAGLVYPVTWAYFTIARYGWSPAMIGASLAWAGATMAAVQILFVGRIVGAVGERRSALIGMAAGTFAFVALAIAPDGWMVFPILAFSSFQTLAQPSLFAMMSARVAADAQGELQGFNGSVNALAAIAAPLMLSPVLARFTAPDATVRFAGAAFVLSAVAAVAAMAVLARTAQRPPRAAA